MSHFKKSRFSSSISVDTNNDSASKWCKVGKKEHRSEDEISKAKWRAVRGIVDAVLDSGGGDNEHLFALRGALEHHELIDISKGLGYVHSETTSVSLYFLQAIAKTSHRINGDHLQNVDQCRHSSSTKQIPRTRLQSDKQSFVESVLVAICGSPDVGNNIEEATSSSVYSSRKNIHPTKAAIVRALQFKYTTAHQNIVSAEKNRCALSQKDIGVYWSSMNKSNSYVKITSGVCEIF